MLDRSIQNTASIFNNVGAKRVSRGGIDKFAGSRHFTRGPYGERGRGRALFMIDPDGNETEVNTRYLYGVPKH